MRTFQGQILVALLTAGSVERPVGTSTADTHKQYAMAINRPFRSVGLREVGDRCAAVSGPWQQRDIEGQVSGKTNLRYRPVPVSHHTLKRAFNAGDQLPAKPVRSIALLGSRRGPLLGNTTESGMAARCGVTSPAPRRWPR